MQADVTISLSEGKRKTEFVSARRVSKARALRIGFFSFVFVRLLVIAVASFVALFPDESLLGQPTLLLMVLGLFVYNWAREALPQLGAFLVSLLVMSIGYVLTIVLADSVNAYALSKALTPVSKDLQPIDTFQIMSYVLAIPIGIRAYFWSQTAKEQTSLLLETVLNLFRSRNAVIGMSIIAALILMGDFAPYIATHDPTYQLYNDPAEAGFAPLPKKPPCVPLLGCTEPQHLLGMDQNARDIFSRIVYGARASLYVGIASVSMAIIVGTSLGLIAGYAGGWTDNLIMRFMDALLAFPSLLLAIAIVTVLGPGLQNALIAISIVSIPGYARLARASTLSVKELEFVTAERALGANPARILFGQIFPNTLTPLIVQATLGIGGAVLEAAALSFIGLGAQPPRPEWGQMLSEARSFVFTVPHMVFFPGIFIMITVLGFNLLGDGMRDALDPRLNRN